MKFIFKFEIINQMSSSQERQNITDSSSDSDSDSDIEVTYEYDVCIGRHDFLADSLNDVKEYCSFHNIPFRNIRVYKSDEEGEMDYQNWKYINEIEK